ncbi:hypothetical protein [Gimesia aquarii]|uniref:Uncharacterized protein n=1 Tax=Gimesia aquarii TaxID=2527964 RepID=A0A517WR98_9PLAN|nr:hypothetical protein [Gimesia aquarii]QDU07773.1 hypothetical protein V202x_11340 [Gimesia aquarii]
MSDQKGQNYSLFDLYFSVEYLGQRNDKQWKALNAQWKAGWLDVDTFAVSNDKFGTRVWQYREDNSFAELPQPIDSQLEERVMSLQSSPWRRPPALDIIRKVKEMGLKKCKDGN